MSIPSSTSQHDHAGEAPDDRLQLQFIAQCLRAQAPVIAAGATRRLLAANPQIVRRYQPQPDRQFHQALEGRVIDLAESIAVGQPEILKAQVAWSRAAHRARSVPVEDILRSLEALAQEVAQHVAPEDAPIVSGYVAGAIEHLHAAPQEPPAFLCTTKPFGRDAAEYLLSILEGDRRAAAACLQCLLESGTPLVDLYEKVITPVLNEMGRMWHLGDVNIAEEHFATATTLSVMAVLAAMTPTAPPNGRTAVVCAAEGNNHEVGARMVADLLEIDGWRTVYLGPNMPAEDLALAVRDFSADLVAISATLHTHIQPTADTIRLLRSTAGFEHVKVIIGGAAVNAVPNACELLGADASACSPAQAVALARRLVLEP